MSVDGVYEGTNHLDNLRTLRKNKNNYVWFAKGELEGKKVVCVINGLGNIVKYNTVEGDDTKCIPIAKDEIYVYDIKPVQEAITNIEATVAESKLGETPATTAIFSTTPGNAVELKSVIWYKVAKKDYKEDATWIPLDKGETFKTGYYYGAEISFNVKEGFKLTDETAGKVNGIDRKICKEEETGTPYLETIFDPLSYEIIEGKDGKWTKGATDPLTFRGDGAFAKFTKVNVDGKELAATNYDKSEGSTIIKLKAAYLETLSEGTHKLEMIWGEESAETTFTIEKKSDVPATGDNSGMFLWALAIIGAIAAGVAAGICLKKKEN